MKGVYMLQRGISHSVLPQEALGFVLGEADGERLAQVHQTRLHPPLLTMLVLPGSDEGQVWQMCSPPDF